MAADTGIPLAAFRVGGKIIAARAIGVRPTSARLSSSEITFDGMPSDEAMVTISIAGGWAECARTGEDDANLEGAEASDCITLSEVVTGKKYATDDQPRQWFLARSRQAKRIIDENIEPLKRIAIALTRLDALDAQAIESACSE